ncbi:MAG: hypothetical protein A3H28_03315 [Acidobacteria bacterium RIFCSPLOWO2_02_FULL_61_28]|nr:MAG: hypothetical protein A3H28_03315 [Acidobacteria bacterium RIFCSPLOWO2_02_FULL_61_28]
MLRAQARALGLARFPNAVDFLCPGNHPKIVIPTPALPGGGNVWNLAVNQEELAATVPFYGAPVPSAEAIERIKSPVLAIYAELDRNLTLGMIEAARTRVNQRKTFGLHIYQGAGHAFHNDTSPAYNAAAACEAWNRTLAWFNKFLRPPAAA